MGSEMCIRDRCLDVQLTEFNIELPSRAPTTAVSSLNRRLRAQRQARDVRNAAAVCRLSIAITASPSVIRCIRQSHAIHFDRVHRQLASDHPIRAPFATSIPLSSLARSRLPPARLPETATETRAITPRPRSRAWTTRDVPHRSRWRIKARNFRRSHAHGRDVTRRARVAQLRARHRDRAQTGCTKIEESRRPEQRGVLRRDPTAP